MAAPKILAEYAKSNRSSCKTCSKNIPSGSLRLGIPIKDPRGFDSVKWHHLGCFPKKFHSLGIPEGITGFSFLKSSDQDALRKLEAESSLNPSINVDQNVDADSTLDGWRQPNLYVWSQTKPMYLSIKVTLQGVLRWGQPESFFSQSCDKGNRKEIEQLDEMEVKKRKLSGAEIEEKLEVKISLSDAKNMYKDAILPPKWKAFETIIFNEGEEGLRNTEKIAAFDFDGCLVNTSVKRIGADAWSLMYPSIPEKLQELYNGGHKLVIFSNESNIERWKNKRQLAVDSKIGRLDQFIKLVKVPIQVFIACGFGNAKKQIEDPFRKPGTGMWQILVEKFNSATAIDMDQSFYVGDAAGRANDHSDADIKFAKGIGLKFYVPEEFFGA